MGHLGRVHTFASAAAALTTVVVAATPALAGTDCFPRAAPALYSVASPMVFGDSPGIVGAPRMHAPRAAHAAAWRGGPYHIVHRHAPGHRLHVARAGGLQLDRPAAFATPGVELGAPLPGLVRAATLPEACAPAPPPIGIGPMIAAAAPPRDVGGLEAFIPSLAPTGTAVDTSGVTGGVTDTDTETVFPIPADWTNQPPEVIGDVFPGTGVPGGGGPGGGVPGGGVPGGGVPEPSGWILMLAGLFGMGAILRFSRRKAARARNA